MATPRLPIVRLPARLDDPVFLGNHALEQSAALRIVLIDRQVLLKLTPIEYRIFTHLLAQPRTLVTDDDLIVIALQTKGYQCDPQIPRSIERHIRSLQLQLKHSGIEILRVVRTGWLLTDSKEKTTDE